MGRSRDPPLREPYAGSLSARLSPGARVLELGCGPGVPVAKVLTPTSR
ncbi:MAG TPA: hypothetical protein VFA45_13255 [Actinomycetes bacterium]|nr:hypothetical protein [Actinomycetes bacterium]